jgi:hypothetical protein
MASLGELPFVTWVNEGEPTVPASACATLAQSLNGGFTSLNGDSTLPPPQLVQPPDMLEAAVIGPRCGVAALRK